MAQTVMFPPDRKTELVQRETRIMENISGVSEDYRYIRDESLWREDDYESWPEYCAKRWGTTHQTIDRIINHEWVVENIAEVTPAGVTYTQSATREMEDLAPEQQREVAAALPANKRKPSRKDVQKARSDAGLPPKRKNKPRKPKATESHRMPQDASENGTAHEPYGITIASETPSPTWMERFQAMCQLFGELFRSGETEQLGDKERELIAAGLRNMANCVPVSISWQDPDVVPGKDAVDRAVGEVSRIVVEAQNWTDTEAVARLVDEFQKSIHRLAPENGDSDSQAVTITEEMDEVVAAWNSTGNAKCQKLTPKRRRTLRARLKDQFWRDNWKQAIVKATGNQWIKDTGLGLDWFLQEDKVIGLVEGRFDKMADAFRRNGAPASRKLVESYGESGRL